jgi:hypothetical protein
MWLLPRDYRRKFPSNWSPFDDELHTGPALNGSLHRLRQDKSNLIHFFPGFGFVFHSAAMTFRGEQQSVQLPADQVYATLPVCIPKSGALSVPRLGEGSNAIPAPVRTMRFATRARRKASIEFVEDCPMHPRFQSRKITALHDKCDEDEDDTDSSYLQSSSPLCSTRSKQFLAEIPLRQSDDSDSSSYQAERKKW